MKATQNRVSPCGLSSKNKGKTLKALRRGLHINRYLLEVSVGCCLEIYWRETKTGCGNASQGTVTQVRGAELLNPSHCGRNLCHASFLYRSLRLRFREGVLAGEPCRGGRRSGGGRRVPRTSALVPQETPEHTKCVTEVVQPRDKGTISQGLRTPVAVGVGNPPLRHHQARWLLEGKDRCRCEGKGVDVSH